MGSVVVDLGSLQNSFSHCIYSGVRIINRDGSMVMLFPYSSSGSRQANWGMQGEKSVPGKRWNYQDNALISRVYTCPS